MVNAIYLLGLLYWVMTMPSGTICTFFHGHVSPAPSAVEHTQMFAVQANAVGLFNILNQEGRNVVAALFPAGN
jgi:hypothetical protein